MAFQNSFAVDEYYHLYNRGTDKRKIFLSPRDYHRFLFLLYLCNDNAAVDMQKVFRSVKSFSDVFSSERGDRLVNIGAYCLMPNHFHLLVREMEEGGITIFMKKLLTAYSMYFNIKYKRTGGLFQGVFKSRFVGRDEYLKYLFSYIHLNPIKLIQPNWKDQGINNLSAAKLFLQDYKHSSYSDYLNISRPQKSILSREVFPEYFEIPDDFTDFINEWLTFGPKEL